MVSKCKTLNKHFLENAKLENTKKNKGFTLIELLAVIVILAVIALIAIPLITNIIGGVRKEAAKDSAYGYIESLEYNNGISEIESNNGLEDGTYKVRDLESKVNIKGNKPIYGTVTIKDKKVSNANLCIGGYIVSYDGLNAKALSSCTEKEDETGPDIVIGTISGTTSSLTIPFTAIDEETGIESVSCFYSTDKSYNLKGKIENNECKLSNLKNDTLYNFKIEATNNGGIKGEITGSHKTGNFESIEVLVSPSDWSSSKKVTIKGSTAGSTLEYKVVSGTTVKTDWTKYTSDITVDWAANTITPTYIYARLNDNVNVSETASLTITKIDTTEPILNLSTATSTTNSITVPISASDSESGIKSTTCSYGLSTSYGSKGVISSNNCVMSGLKNNTTYYYQVTTTNNAGLTTTKTGSVKTGEFDGIEITASPSDWSSSKKVTIKGSTAGSTLEYRVVSGTTVKTDWTKYTSDITVDWAANTTTPTYIYARLNDNVNVSETASLTITKIDITAPILSLANASVTTNSITVPISASDSESGIKSTTCSYGLSTSYGSKGVISSNNCVMSGLKNNTTYYYQVTTTNNAGLTTTKTGNIKTGEFASVEIEATPSDWSSSKNVSIKGSTAGSTLEYRVVSGTTVKTDWTKYTSDITIDWAANTTTPTYIYARLNDNVNVSETASLTITKVDTTAPILTFKEITSTTKDITISFASNSDSESGIKSTVCKYGTSSDNYNLTGKVNSDKTNCVIEGTANSTYFYQITTTNNAGLTKTVTGNTKTQAFSSIKINLSPVDWSSSKNITIDGVTSGATLEYKVVSGTTIKTNWTEYKGNFVIDWAASVSNPTYIYARFNDSKNYSDEESLTITKIDTTSPILNILTPVTTTNSIVIPTTISDSESGIKSTTCSYGVSTNYGSVGVIGENNCSMSGLKNNTTYYYKITTTNNAGLTTTKTGNVKTGEFSGIEITTSPSDWSSSKKVTIKGSTAGATLEYKVVSGTTVKTDWTKYTSDITINWAANTTTPTYIYARFNDSNNYSNEESFTITKVDTTEPTLSLSNASVTTNSITIPVIASDSESGIKNTTCSYGLSTSYGSTGTMNSNNCNISKLKNNATYYYQITTTNNAGLTTTKTGSVKTGEFAGITISVDSESWEAKKIVTITGSTNGATLEYRVVSGTTVKTDWTKYTSDITIDWAANTTTPTYIYARLNDNVNVSETASLTITKIDTTAPSCNIKLKSNTTSSVLINAECEDDESGVKEYYFKIGNGEYTKVDSNEYEFKSLRLSEIKVKVVDYCGNYKENQMTEEDREKAYDVIYNDIKNKVDNIKANIFLINHPIGSIYETVNSDENTAAKMASKYGGTWEAFGTNRVLRGSSQSASTTGGSDSVKLSASQIPSITASGNTNNTGSGYSYSWNTTGTNNATTANGGSHSHKYVVETAGSNYSMLGYAGFKDRVYVTAYLSEGNATSTAGNHSHNYSNKYVTSVSGFASHGHSITNVRTNNSQTNVSVVDPYITVYRYKRVS